MPLRPDQDGFILLHDGVKLQRKDGTILQRSTTGATGGFTANAGTAMNSASTSTGGTGSSAYTFGDVVAALKGAGVLAL